MSEEILETLYQQDDAYAEQWEKEADRWTEVGLYRMLANAIELKGDAIHVDACTGRGDLLSALKKKYPQARVIGTEIKAPLIKRGIRKMKEIGIQGIGFSDYDLSIDFARKIVGLRYNVDSRKINSVRQAVRTGSIAMVCDDMREHRLLDALLNNEKIDSGSFGNPGGLAPLTQLAPYSVHTITETEANVRLGEIARNLRRAVHVFMRKNIKPEGKLTLYERAQYPGTPREEDVLATIEKILGEEKQYWEKPVVSVSQQSFVNKNQVGAGVTWYGMERDYASHHTTSPLSLIVCQIQRRTDL